MAFSIFVVSKAVFFWHVRVYARWGVYVEWGPNLYIFSDYLLPVLCLWSSNFPF